MDSIRKNATDGTRTRDRACCRTACENHTLSFFSELRHFLKTQHYVVFFPEKLEQRHLFILDLSLVCKFMPFRKTRPEFSLTRQNWHSRLYYAGADLRGGGPRDARPGVQILSISCSFWKNMAKSYVGAPPPRGVGAPSSGKSWSATEFRQLEE